MTTTTLHMPRVRRNTHEKIRYEAIPIISWKLVCAMGFLAIFLLLIFYVWQINGLTGGSYAILNYEKQIAQLSEENKNLQVSFAESGFLGEVLLKAQKLNFQKVASVKYVKIPDNSFAMAK